MPLSGSGDGSDAGSLSSSASADPPTFGFGVVAGLFPPVQQAGDGQVDIRQPVHQLPVLVKRTFNLADSFPQSFDGLEDLI